MNTVEGLQVTRYVRKCYTGEGYEWSIVRGTTNEEILHGHCSADDLPESVRNSQYIQRPGVIWPL